MVSTPQPLTTAGASSRMRGIVSRKCELCGRITPPVILTDSAKWS
jgi:hypothetical protein